MRNNKIILRVASAVAIAVVLFAACACSPKVNVRDMSEVVSRGSFAFFMGNNADKITDLKKTLVFDTYDEFCNDAISETVIFSRNEHVNNKYTLVEYQAKNERYNADYFENNNLVVAFFETDLKADKFIVTDVEFAADECNISVAATLMSKEKRETKVPYACFVETTDDVTKGLSAKVSVVYTSLLSSTTVNFSDATTASDVEKVSACLFNSVDELNRYVADCALFSETSSLKSVLSMRYTAEYFQQSALLIVETPGEFYGYYNIDGNAVCGIRLDSDHYDSISFEDSVAPRTRKAVAVLLSVLLDFDFESVTFSFQSYCEWEQGVDAVNTQSGQIVLLRHESGTSYVQQDV